MLKPFERQDRLLDASDTLQKRKWCPLYTRQFLNEMYLPADHPLIKKFLSIFGAFEKNVLSVGHNNNVL